MRQLPYDIPAPAYVLDEQKLLDNLALLDRVQREAGAHIILALKGFAMWSVFDRIRRFLPGSTASSLWELKLASETLGGEKHIYAPAYRDDEFEEIAHLADHIVFNSASQLARFQAQALAADCSLGLRVNPGINEVSTEIYNPCRTGSRLGVLPEQLAKIPMDHVSGLHAHALCENLHDSSIRLIDTFERKFGHLLPRLKWVNLGGGHLMTHADYDLDALIARLADFRERWGVEVYLEPGGAIAWQAGYLVASVLDIVETERLPVAILDVSATCHMPDVLEMPYRPDVLGAGMPGEKPYGYCLAGPSCLAGDIIGDYAFDHPLHAGDRIVFEDMAHYTMVKTTMFNGVRHPDISLLRCDGSYQLIRHFTYGDFKSRLS